MTPIIIEKWPEKPIVLRQENDSNARVFQIDLSEYIEEFGAGGTFGIRIQRLADGNVWTGEVTADGGIITWTVPAAAVAKSGRGFIQFVYSVGDTIVANSPLIPTFTPASIPTDELPPDPWKPWTDQIEEQIAGIQNGKADKVSGATADDIATLDANGNLQDGGKKISDLQDKLTFDQTPTAGSTNPVTSGGVYAEFEEVKTKKADKVSGATADDIATLDANGNLRDGGKKISDLQDKLTFDQTPTNGSANPVTSGGVYEALTLKAEKSVVEAISALIPSQASPENQLADKDFVNSSVSTNTANYISNDGQPFTSVAQLEAYSGPVTNNDYAFVTGTDAAGNTYYDRYKATVTTGGIVTWALEYRLNNSSFTAEQWAAIQSGITAALVSAYIAHLADRSNPHEVTKAQIGLGNVDNTSDDDKPVSTAQQTALNRKTDKVFNATEDDIATLDANGNVQDGGKKISDLQDKLTFDQTPTAGSANPVTSGGIKTAIETAISTKADKVAGAVAGNLAGLDASGNLTDSGFAASDLEPIGTASNDPDSSVFDTILNPAASAPVMSSVIKGKTVAWNQLVQNGDFSDGATGWDKGTANNGILTVTPATVGELLAGNVLHTINGHLYFVSAELSFDTALPSTSVNIGSGGFQGATFPVSAFSLGSFVKCEGFFTRGTGGTDTIRIYFRNPNAGDVIRVRNVYCIDLTAEGYTSSETTDVETFKAAFLRRMGYPLPQYIPYDAGSLKNVDGEHQLTGKNIFDQSVLTTATNWAFDGEYYAGSPANLINTFGKENGGFLGSNLNEQRQITISLLCGNLSYAGTTGYIHIAYTDGTTSQITISGDSVVKRTVTSTAGKIIDCVYYVANLNYSFKLKDFQIEYGTSATAYEPYYSGGTIDCSEAPLNGVGDAQDEADFAKGTRTDRAKLIDLSDINFAYNSGWNCWTASLPTDGKRPSSNSAAVNAVCGIAKAVPASGYTSNHAVGTFAVNTAGTFFFDNGSSTVAPSRNFCYELATPVTSSITPQPLTTQDGYNLLRPTSGDVQSAEVTVSFVKRAASQLVQIIKALIGAAQ